MTFLYITMYGEKSFLEKKLFKYFKKWFARLCCIDLKIELNQLH